MKNKTATINNFKKTIFPAFAMMSLLAVGACGGDDLDSRCGNARVEPGETCDDGNIRNGDGCSALCRIENGTGFGSSLLCGNGRIDAGETCDDGNQFGGDGCSAACRREGIGGVGNDGGFPNNDGGFPNNGGGFPNNGGGFPNNGGGFPNNGGGQFELTCGSSHRWATDAPGATQNSRGYDCTRRDTWGPEITYNFIAPNNADVYVRLDDGADNEFLDIYAIDQNGRCIADGTRDASFIASAGQSFALVVDGRHPTDYKIDVRCNSFGGNNNGGFNNGGFNNGGFNNGGFNNGGFNNGGFGNGGFGGLGNGLFSDGLAGLGNGGFGNNFGNNNGGFGGSFQNGQFCYNTQFGNFCI